MTWKHAFIICFSLLIVAICGMSSTCQPMTSKLGDLALVVIGAVGGNAMNEIKHGSVKHRKRSNVK